MNLIISLISNNCLKDEFYNNTYRTYNIWLHLII